MGFGFGVFGFLVRVRLVLLMKWNKRFPHPDPIIHCVLPCPGRFGALGLGLGLGFGFGFWVWLES